MKTTSVALGASGLVLLALAAWLVPSPRTNPRPGLPEIEPFAPGERVALILPEPATFPPADSLGVVQRARAAGADIRVFAPGETMAAFAPDRAYQLCPDPGPPAGYHPDQWPALPADEPNANRGWQMLVLTPEEIACKNEAIVAAARVIRTSTTNDPGGSRELRMLSRARRAERLLPILP